MVNCVATLNALAADYAADGTWIGLCTGNPGTGTTPAHEATGGSYARVQTTWGAGATGTQTGTACLFNVPPGNYTYMIICTGSTGNNMIDNVAITAVPMLVDGQISLTPTFIQT